jgi:hypothetical protein
MAQEQRFTLQWDRPFMPGAATHVSLFEGGTDPMNIVASGHGSDEVSALRDLLAALKERHESPGAIAFVSDEYAVLSGKPAEQRRP